MFVHGVGKEGWSDGTVGVLPPKEAAAEGAAAAASGGEEKGVDLSDHRFRRAGGNSFPRTVRCVETVAMAVSMLLSAVDALAAVVRSPTAVRIVAAFMSPIDA